MKMNKMGITTLQVKLMIITISLLLPLLSIFVPNYELIADDHYVLGLPFRFLNYYGESLPMHRYELFTWYVFTRHVLFNVPLYALNFLLVYVIVTAIIKIIFKKRKRDT
ncbi:hypothetical protein P4H71_09310 [Paenibacillus kribbensis]|uniref:hypothetical protein n=1 Tax=Paenibacillus kribbensis TaxID=172713 RepID=UPI002DB9CE63|nr:hypothetical protein [Paenibacillus kribbensis]MEC0234524.1 hypothetical protein [Paenibacillus kribbensis]